MAQSRTEQLIAWLDDAYAMETGLVAIIQSHASHFSNVPQVAQRMHQHIVETQQHAQRVEQCLRILGRTPSTVKSTLSSIMATAEGMSTSIFSDQRMKDALADYASEQFEVGCYTALVAAARELGYTEIAMLCEANLREDLAMAEWLLMQLPSVVWIENRPAA
jgi:ferritin-like metal-binding protein YciE